MARQLSPILTIRPFPFAPPFVVYRGVVYEWGGGVERGVGNLYYCFQCVAKHPSSPRSITHKTSFRHRRILVVVVFIIVITVLRVEHIRNEATPDGRGRGGWFRAKSNGNGTSFRYWAINTRASSVDDFLLPRVCIRYFSFLRRSWFFFFCKPVRWSLPEPTDKYRNINQPFLYVWKTAI